jgi:ArsR family transcriptional regulator
VQTVATKLQRKTFAEPDALEKLAADLRVIADESRLRILDFLTAGEQCVCDITQALGLSQPLISYHLAVLREAGLVCVRRDARWLYYSINVERLQQINAYYRQLFDPERISTAPWQEREGRCK